MAEQDRRRLRADSRHARNVVDRIAHQGEEIGDLLRMHAEALFDPLHVPALVTGKIPLFDRLTDQLPEILVGRDDDRRTIMSSERTDRAADQIVGLVAGVGEHGQAQRRGYLLAIGELADQLGGRQFAIGLVVRIDRIAKGTGQRFIEADRRMGRFGAFEEIQQEAGKAMHGIDRMAIDIGEIGRNRMPGAEHVKAGVNQIRPVLLATDHGVHSASMSASVARGCSAAGSTGVPICTKPITCSPASRPSSAATASS